MKKFISVLMIMISAVTTFAIVIGTVALGWFSGPKITLENEVINGEIGLRGYFYDGDGLTQETAFEIVTPTHYYNLTRLQNLGIFAEKRYFQIGHDFGSSTGIACINTDDEGNISYDKFLDMEDICERTQIYPIGGEATPFVGTFEGNGINIKNLTVSGYPEDIGMFGYVGHEGSVTDVVCENLNITSLGYTTDTTSPDYELFDPEVEKIFDENVPEISAQMSLAFVDGVGSGATTHQLKHPNGLAGTQLTTINASSKLFTDSYIYKGYFVPTYPNRNNDPFTYSWKASAPMIREVLVDIDEDGTDEKIIAMDLEPLKDSTDGDDCFNSGNDMEADCRLSLIASVEIDGYVYSRVVQSYVVEFYSNSSIYENGNYGAGIFCDYVDTLFGDTNTNYHHGNNIGLLAGHVDGSFTNSYVYCGQFKFNETGYTPIDAESETALIGEIGSHVSSNLDPEYSLVTNGDIGVMNFSRIYSLIRRDMDADSPHTILAGKARPFGSNDAINYFSYDDFKNTDTFDNFSEYLRHDDPTEGPIHYIAKTEKDMGSYVDTGYTITNTSQINWDFNSVDFIWNKVIQDEDNIDRGLGVFKIVTGNCSEVKSDPIYGKYMLNTIGDSRIINSTPKTKVYFSTCEYDHTKGGTWDPIRGVSLPNYSDVNSFNYPFSRDYNYCFELDLEDMDKSGGKNYMWNTDSTFLTNYLKSILIDKFGQPVTPKSNKFGFMFRSSENEQLDQLSSYMPVKKPGDKQPYEVDGVTQYYPPNSIVFRIENEAGANVSVVGRDADITIYRNNPNTTEGVKALYTMKAASESRPDMMRYFTYDVETGVTGTEAQINPNMSSDSKNLYAHIFKLPKGDYVLGARDNTANVYFLAVQGQNNATIGDKSISYIGSAVDSVDFITAAPSPSNVFPFANSLAMLSFKMNFNSQSGTMNVGIEVYDDKRYMSITFLDSPKFVTYLFLYSRHQEHTYFVNGTMYTTTPTLYPREQK